MSFPVARAVAEMYLADRLWISVAMLHREHPERGSFSKDEIRRKFEQTGLDSGTKDGSVSAHLSQHLVANVQPSTTKRYRMLFDTGHGLLRLFRPGDFVEPSRLHCKTFKQIPARDDVPSQYWPLLDWYANWAGTPEAEVKWEDDPLIRLIGSGREVWADEHADEYVENLRREDD